MRVRFPRRSWMAPLGLAPKPGGASELESPRSPWRHHVGIRLLVLLAWAGLMWAFFPGSERYDFTYQVGDIWRRADVEAPFDFAIYKSEAELEREREQVRRQTPPVFRGQSQSVSEAIGRLDSLLNRLEEAFVVCRLASRSAEDSLRCRMLRQALPLGSVREEEWTLWMERWAQPGDRRRLIRVVREVLEAVLQRGVLDVPRSTILAPQLAVRFEEDQLERLVPVMNALDEQEALQEGYRQLADRLQEPILSLGFVLYRAVLGPNWRYDAKQTEAEVAARLSGISPTRDKVKQGQIIVRRGDKITPEIYAQLRSLERAHRERAGLQSHLPLWLGQALLLCAVLSIFWLYLYLFRGPIFRDNAQLLLIGLLFGLVMALHALAYSIAPQARWGVPMALAPILLAVIFDSRVGFFGAATLAVLGGLYWGKDFELTVSMFVGSALAVFSVRDITHRGQFFATAGLVLLAQAVVWLGFALLRLSPWEEVARVWAYIGAGVVLTLLAYPLLWVVERLFGVVTDITLLELSNTNHPLLRELAARAPGTFTHTLQVAALAEAGAEAIGAHRLLTRVGALYHDIGKMRNPLYFIENQQGFNPHEQLEPQESARIVIQHVFDGLELARRYRLPDRVAAFIAMHHGTTLVRFFYEKARQGRALGEGPPEESAFRYPGPRPRTRETAILMLADGVEAAATALAQPDVERIARTIDRIVQERLEDGQLAESPLTFRDLERIKAAFLQRLLARYHQRLPYPGQEGVPEIDAADHAGRSE